MKCSHYLQKYCSLSFLSPYCAWERQEPKTKYLTHLKLKRKLFKSVQFLSNKILSKSHLTTNDHSLVECLVFLTRQRHITKKRNLSLCRSSKRFNFLNHNRQLKFFTTHINHVLLKEAL